jgi:hypothetical protein
MHSRQRVDQMKTGRECFIAYIAEKIDDSRVAGGYNASGAKQQDGEKNYDDKDKNRCSRIHETKFRLLSPEMSKLSWCDPR